MIRRSPSRRRAPRRRTSAAISGGVAAALLVVTLWSSGLASAEVQVPDCVAVSTQAPYQGYGYTHIIHVANSCDFQVRCAVASSVDPAPQNVVVEAGAATDVVTRRGSPSSAFSAEVRCSSR